MSCSQERTVASEQFKKSPTPKLVKIFNPRYVSGLQGAHGLDQQTAHTEINLTQCYSVSCVFCVVLVMEMFSLALRLKMKPAWLW